MAKSSVFAYRADIDGLRALAISMVVLFHFWPNSLPGGFIGVDVFFVISGFLITSIMHREIVQGTFSFKIFYLHRIKRILPAFFTMLFVVYGLAYFLLLPDEFKAFAISADYASVYLSNIHFMKAANYFAVSSAENPLLHTWSLAVEEQYYLLWPVLFYFGMKCFHGSRRQLYGGMLFIFVCSLIYSVYCLHHDGRVSYYSVFSRAFELMLGAMIALRVASRAHAPKSQRISLQVLANILGGAGLLLILFSGCCLSENQGFPGFYGLLPTLGAALIIYAGHIDKKALVNRLLAQQIVVRIGLISYSIYLFHWPVIAFWHYFYPEVSPSIFSGLLMLIGVFLISLLTYRWVEQPFKRFKFSFLKCFMLYQMIPLFIVLGLSYPIIKLEGVPSRISREIYLESNFLSENYCHNRRDDKGCIFGKTTPFPPKVIFFGDSHAAQLFSFFDKMAKEYNFSIKMISTSSCFPLLDTYNHLPSTSRNTYFPACQEQVRYLTEHYNDYDVFILAGSYSEYIDDGRLHPENFGFLSEFNNTLKFLTRHGKHVIVMGDIPFEKDNVITYLIRRQAIFGKDKQYRQFLKMIHMDDQEKTNNLIKVTASAYGNAYYFDTNQQFFGGVKTLPFYQDTLIYKNNSHLNKSGSELLATEYLSLSTNPIKEHLHAWGVIDTEHHPKETQ